MVGKLENVTGARRLEADDSDGCAEEHRRWFVVGSRRGTTVVVAEMDGGTGAHGGAIGDGGGGRCRWWRS